MGYIEYSALQAENEALRQKLDEAHVIIAAIQKIFKDMCVNMEQIRTLKELTDNYR